MPGDLAGSYGLVSIDRVPMSLHSILQAFATVFPAELPDKTMVATVVLVTRFRRPFWVWVGAVAAFCVHVTVAVAAGSALGLLPEPVVKSVVALLFLIGGILLLREARRDRDDELEGVAEVSSTIRSTVLGSFGLVVLAEWGDLTQLATASLAARSGDPVGTAVGALTALAAVAAIAAAFGGRLVKRVPLQRINYLGATVFLALAGWTVVDLLTA